MCFEEKYITARHDCCCAGDRGGRVVTSIVAPLRDDLAAAAGVATGTVYRYFPSKGELFAEALALNAQHEVDVVAAVAAAEGSTASRLADALRVFADRAVRARRLAWAMIAEFERRLDREGLALTRALIQEFASSPPPARAAAKRKLKTSKTRAPRSK